ncbi:hypothetical protein A3K93_01755 [Acinetobacter sp. NCu2D-2]|uniref:tetratricopeptide repeat protein n=1 Tax=Acinetobacter sp. NCu2D-2 TaxID=1608473 RepID=UPI0007CE0826|nr:tetratricopeptide repeat protein [Acinetobacter sp. NCu2D-2]ANF81039.1 hypothetical protein A3K93_01755 [Acinetobacter sp. NCu2D-2]
MWFLLVLILGIAALAIWMWKRPDPVQRDQAKAVQHDLWIEQIDAQYKHALRLINDPAQPNFSRAFEILEQLAQQHDLPQAYTQMGLMHLKGQGREVSVESAIGLLDKAFRLGGEDAAFHLGKIYESEQYQHHNIEKALYWYRHAVARGNVEAQLKITELTPNDDKNVALQKFELLKKNAEQGHANSQFQLAQHYLHHGQQQDISLGMHYLFSAAKQDVLAANQQIADYYANGYLLPQDPTQALQLIKRSVNLGGQQGLYQYYQGVLLGWIDADQRQRVFQHLLQQSQEHKDLHAKTLLGTAYFYGWYVSHNETMAYRYWTEAAKADHPPAIVILAALHYEQYLVTDAQEQAFTLYNQALELDSTNFQAQIGLALCYLNAVGTAQDSARATQMIQTAVEAHWGFDARSEADLIYAVGRFYGQIDYPLPNRDKAIHYLNQAVSKGSADAAWYLYQAFSGIYPVFVSDVDQANRYLHQAAKLGHAEAQATLGQKYLFAQNIEQDSILGLQYLQQSAVQQNPMALNALGQAYEQGTGVETDLNQAVAYYKRAANFANADAYAHLGRLYTKGIGVERDITIARDWLEKGSLLGNETAQQLLQSIHDYLEINE